MDRRVAFVTGASRVLAEPLLRNWHPMAVTWSWLLALPIALKRWPKKSPIKVEGRSLSL